ncbi:hypothetical protein [Frigoribacterium faeni]|uniref:Uncharacterized protein n=1 Tax=Frigoribacterium faeni TaxID=145483 RepID=A0A7W3JH63_9MICO|nr:hypothetical protein [Frigoribacterium faeni]MBA8812716.1 hypothetical protein [Frigoribacterium faeni]
MTDAPAPGFTMLGSADAVVCDGDSCALPSTADRPATTDGPRTAETAAPRS